MRTIFFAAVALATALTGCGQFQDNTQNRMDNTSDDVPHDPNYPAGPYGYKEQSTVADYKFLGKIPVAGDYKSVPLNPLYLDQFHNDTAVKYLLIEGSANWCYYCNEEAPNIEALAEARYNDGFRALTILAEGPVQGEPSNEDDVMSWVKKHKLTTGLMGIDPAERLFQYAPASAFPLHILVDTSTMQIKWLCVGGIGGCDTEKAVNDALDAK